MDDKLFHKAVTTDNLYQAWLQVKTKAVDRVVIAYITKGKAYAMEDGWLDNSTRKKLAAKVLERLNKVETFRKQETRLSDIINSQAIDLYKLIIGKKAKYKPYVAKW